MSAQSQPVVIVGAGVSGLCCALHLQERGLRVLLLEADADVGGRVRTDRVDGFLLDRGFQVLLTAYPEARAMLDRLDGERSKYVGAYYGLDWADAALYDVCVSTSKLTPDQMIDFILQGLSHLEENPDPEHPLVREVEADPILDQAISEALSLLEATGRMD